MRLRPAPPPKVVDNQPLRVSTAPTAEGKKWVLFVRGAGIQAAAVRWPWSAGTMAGKLKRG